MKFDIKLYSYTGSCLSIKMNATCEMSADSEQFALVFQSHIHCMIDSFTFNPSTVCNFHIHSQKKNYYKLLINNLPGKLWNNIIFLYNFCRGTSCG